MSCLVRRPGLSQALFRPRCHQPWLQRRTFTASPQTRDETKPSESASQTRDETTPPKKKKIDRGPKGVFMNDHMLRMSGRSLRDDFRLKADKAPNKSTILGQDRDLPIRARFAPSPTGYLHLGSLRTALFNKLAATASNGGSFILRIEDTDQNRLVKDAEERLLADLKWAGLEWDEGPDCGGEFGPYRQSERLDIYNERIDHLLDKGHAYRCFCSAEDLRVHDRNSHDQGLPTTYPGTCRSVPREESDRMASEGKDHVVRLNSEPFGRPVLRDAIYGKFQKRLGEDDFILRKTDGFPTYHFANVVDDHLMKITHVIRGNEWLISTPKHLALYEAFGWEPPTFAHLALLINADGSKLSKRNASVDVAKYREENVFPIALLTWLANLGSSLIHMALTPRSVKDIAEALTFKFTKGGVKINPEKLSYLQSKYQTAVFFGEGGPTENEAELIEQHLTQPLLRQIDSITNGTGTDALPETWQQQSLTRVPILASSEADRSQHIRDVLNVSPGTTYTPAGLVKDYPYLLWRVPTSIYETSLVSHPPDPRILAALGKTVADADPWVEAPDTKSQVVPFIAKELEGTDIDQATMHQTLRLILVGSATASAMNTTLICRGLGRDEVAYRLGEVERLIREMPEQDAKTAEQAAKPPVESV